jgi:hypothetical protein
MGSRAFDPALFTSVDACTLGDEERTEDPGFIIVEPCTICGAQDLVRRDDDVLVTLDGEPHVCPDDPVA